MLLWAKGKKEGLISLQRKKWKSRIVYQYGNEKKIVVLLSISGQISAILAKEKFTRSLGKILHFNFTSL